MCMYIYTRIVIAVKQLIAQVKISEANNKYVYGYIHAYSKQLDSRQHRYSLSKLTIDGIGVYTRISVAAGQLIAQEMIK